MRRSYFLISLWILSCTKDPLQLQEKKSFAMVQLNIADAFAPITIILEKFFVNDVTRLQYSERLTVDTTGTQLLCDLKSNIPFENGIYQVRFIKNQDSASLQFWIHRSAEVLPVVITRVQVKSYYK